MLPPFRIIIFRMNNNRAAGQGRYRLTKMKLDNASTALKLCHQELSSAVRLTPNNARLEQMMDDARRMRERLEHEINTITSNHALDHSITADRLDEGYRTDQ